MIPEFHVISIYPTLIDSIKSVGTMRAAIDKNLAQINTINLRDYAVDHHGRVDDRPYGGGDGMVLRPEPLAMAVDAVGGMPQGKPLVILPGPAGRPWTQRDAESLVAIQKPIVFVCGRFAGVDQRFIEQYVDVEFSVGDVVLAGGELPAMMMIESMIRLIPGVLGHQDSAAHDSFSPSFNYGLEHALYTRPSEFRGQKIPEDLLTGDHKKIAYWRDQSATMRTTQRRPDLKR